MKTHSTVKRVRGDIPSVLHENKVNPSCVWDTGIKQYFLGGLFANGYTKSCMFFFVLQFNFISKRKYKIMKDKL